MMKKTALLSLVEPLPNNIVETLIHMILAEANLETDLEHLKLLNQENSQMVHKVVLVFSDSEGKC